MNEQKVLDILFAQGTGVEGMKWDLTAEGQQEALDDLRRKDPPLAKQVERALAPLKKQLFPRGKRCRGTTHPRGHEPV